ncbi:replicative DNA helicase [Caballeronia arationis]|uniref:DnaB-like helicase C-terminal domain-containing protein n=1 Tax=Caballeronia arationis TaxID=1777142 RepID=UPI00074C7B8E|nr:DnaB-like helicase C-terminal domain-containing protein [Caballeronia arationis]SAK84021.1 replicative DNA helicase [Caballeronia arationis]
MTDSPNQISVFISYSHKDERYKESLEEQLASLKRRGKISSWSDRRITPGTNWKAEIDRNIESADIILPLISPSFIASGYCYEKELDTALRRHEDDTARVIPIFVRPADLAEEPLMGIQGLPKDAVSISESQNEDIAWRDVAQGIRAVVDEMRERKERRCQLGELSTLQETLEDMVEGLDRQYHSNADIGGISTGLVDVDRTIDGLHAGQLITIASRPGMGKTNLSLGIAGYVAAEMGMPVLIFSTKIGKKEVGHRLLTITGQISYSRFLRGRLLDEDWSRAVHAIQKLQECHMLLDDTTELNLASLRDSCLAAKKQFGALGLVLVDSITYIKVDPGNVAHEDAVARSLKSLARELNCAIIVTAPVTRLLEARPNKRPIRSDLGNWHELGDESDLLAFVYRDEYYNPDTPDIGVAELIVAKNQYGPIGAVRLSYDQECGIFSNFAGIPPTTLDKADE